MDKEKLKDILAITIMGIFAFVVISALLFVIGFIFYVNWMVGVGLFLIILGIFSLGWAESRLDNM